MKLKSRGKHLSPTAERIEEMKRMRAEGMKLKEIARVFGISDATVCNYTGAKKPQEKKAPVEMDPEVFQIDQYAKTIVTI